jgi:hypothetical protein
MRSTPKLFAAPELIVVFALIAFSFVIAFFLMGNLSDKEQIEQHTFVLVAVKTTVTTSNTPISEFTKEYWYRKFEPERDEALADWSFENGTIRNGNGGEVAIKPTGDNSGRIMLATSEMGERACQDFLALHWRKAFAIGTGYNTENVKALPGQPLDLVSITRGCEETTTFNFTL